MFVGSTVIENCTGFVGSTVIVNCIGFVGSTGSDRELHCVCR